MNMSNGCGRRKCSTSNYCFPLSLSPPKNPQKHNNKKTNTELQRTPNIELLNSTKRDRRNNFLCLILVCVYFNNSYYAHGQLPPTMLCGQSAFQEKQCSQWPLESSRELLLDRLCSLRGCSLRRDFNSPRLPPLSTPPLARDGPFLFVCVKKVFQSRKDSVPRLNSAGLLFRVLAVKRNLSEPQCSHQ